MKLLFKNKFVDYESNKIFNNHGKISLKTGDEINFMPDIEYIVPGFIDQHIHGLLNYDTMDNTIESFKKQIYKDLHKRDKMNNQKRINTLVLISLFSSLSIILSFIKIPFILPYLSIDFSEIIVLLTLYILGVREAIIVAFIKALFMFMFFSISGGIGEIVLFIGSIVLILTYYLLNKKFSVLTSLIGMTILFTIVMVILNYFVIVPLYSNVAFSVMNTQTQTLSNGMILSYFKYIIVIYVPFNLLKGIIISSCYYFVHKRLDFLNKENEIL